MRHTSEPNWQVKQRKKQRIKRTFFRSRQITATKTVPIKPNNPSRLSKQSPAREATVNGHCATAYFRRNSWPWQARTEGGCQHIG